MTDFIAGLIQRATGQASAFFPDIPPVYASSSVAFSPVASVWLVGTPSTEMTELGDLRSPLSDVWPINALRPDLPGSPSTDLAAMGSQPAIPKFLDSPSHSSPSPSSPSIGFPLAGPRPISTQPIMPLPLDSQPLDSDFVDFPQQNPRSTDLPTLDSSFIKSQSLNTPAIDAQRADVPITDVPTPDVQGIKAQTADPQPIGLQPIGSQPTVPQLNPRFQDDTSPPSVHSSMDASPTADLFTAQTPLITPQPVELLPIEPSLPVELPSSLLQRSQTEITPLALSRSDIVQRRDALFPAKLPSESAPMILPKPGSSAGPVFEKSSAVPQERKGGGAHSEAFEPRRTVTPWIESGTHLSSGVPSELQEIQHGYKGIPDRVLQRGPSRNFNAQPLGIKVANLKDRRTLDTLPDALPSEHSQPEISPAIQQHSPILPNVSSLPIYSNPAADRSLERPLSMQAMVPPLQGRSADQKNAPETPPIQVTIGRIEVRVTTPEPAPKPARKKQQRPALSLQDYLQQRGGKSL